MAATARKPKLASLEALPVSRAEAEDAYFITLLASSAERRQHESHDQRVERANKEQYESFLLRQDSLERGISANLTKAKIVRARLDAEERRYVWFRKRYPRAQAEKVYKYLLAAINKRKRLKKISKTTLDRDLKKLRAAGRIPRYHLIPYLPRQ